MEENESRTTGAKRQRRSDTATVAKKTPTRKAVRKTVSAPRKTTTRATTRKAPTTTSSDTKISSSERKLPVRMIAMLSCFLVVVGISAGIGFSDDGQINVSNTIASQRQAEPQYDANGQQVEAPPAPVANRPRNSGLVPSTRSRPKPPEETVPVDTASSTATSTASTTESTSDDTDPSDADSDDAVSSAEESTTESEVTEEGVETEQTDVSAEAPEETEGVDETPPEATEETAVE